MTPKQYRSYFESRFQGQRIPSGPEIKLKCCFHDDRTPSMSIHLDKGIWKCHAGCGEGGVIDFEMKFSNCDRDTAKARVSEVLGESQLFMAQQKPEAVYQYHDSAGRVIFEKVRYPGKRFVQRKPDGRGNYEYKLGDVKKPLYHFPEILIANEIFICEGEKDADNVIKAIKTSLAANGKFLAATTNFDGAGKWREEYSVFFAGKKVAIFPDNDEIGRKHSQIVAASIYPYAAGVKVVELPGLSEKGDVSDYLKSHSADELAEEIKKAKQWRPSEDEKLFVSAADFVTNVRDEVDWIVEGVIERGANGFFCAVPKGGKSWAAIDLAISLAAGANWIGFKVPKPLRVGLVSREDNPALTGWRLKHLNQAKGGDSWKAIQTNLYVNSRAQSRELMLDNPEQVCELIQAAKKRKLEFLILDVFNVMHAADENDNTEMRLVLRQLSQIQAEVGCGIGVVHHFNKSDSGSMTQRLRGSSAIAGWAEWLIGISMANDETKTRKMEFELKAAAPPEPIYYVIETLPSGSITIHKTGTAPPAKGNTIPAERLMQQ